MARKTITRSQAETKVVEKVTLIKHTLISICQALRRHKCTVCKNEFSKLFQGKKEKK